VLIVDDVPDNLAVLHDALDEAGYTVLVATDGHSALQRAAQADPDIVLLDAVMPGMDGFEVARRLKAGPETAHIPIIFMTGLTDTEHVVAAFGAGGWTTSPSPSARPRCWPAWPPTCRPPGRPGKPATRWTPSATPPWPCGRATAACRAALVPALAAIDDLHHRQHDRHLDQHADHRGERRARFEAEQADRRGDRQLEEVAGADQRRGAGDAVRLAGRAVQQIGEPG
jgi:CheY-like chemotaxis protein